MFYPLCKMSPRFYEKENEIQLENEDLKCIPHAPGPGLALHSIE